MAQSVPATTIISAAQSHLIDLIILCSHGDTGIKRWAVGSVAQKVIRQSLIPVLVLHKEGGIPANSHPDGTRSVRVLVGLDGSTLSETALVPAAQLSTALSAPAERKTSHE